MLKRLFQTYVVGKIARRGGRAASRRRRGGRRGRSGLGGMLSRLVRSRT